MWALIGAHGGLTMLVNPTLVLFLAAIFCWTVYQTLPGSRWGPVLGFSVMLAIFAPWPIRNARVMYTPIPLRSNFGFELWKGNRPGAASFDDPELYPATNPKEYTEYARKGEIAYMKDKSAVAREYIQTHPGVFLRLSAERFKRFWMGTGVNVPSVTLESYCVATALLGLVGLWFLVKARQISLAMLFFLPLLIIPLPYYVTHAEPRFRFEVEPVATILSAYTLIRWRVHFRQRKRTAKALVP
jgi:hypothetical protein